MTTRYGRYWSVIALACATCVATAATPEEQVQSRKAFVEQQRTMKADSGAKLGGYLQALSDRVSSGAATQRSNALVGGAPSALDRVRALRVAGAYVPVTAYANGNPAVLQTELVAKGMVDAKLHENAVTGKIPVASLKDMSKSAALKFMRPSLATTRAGLTTSQGDRSMRTDVARQRFGVTGRGVRVGVLSDSYGCATGPLVPGQRFTTASADIASGDLPNDVLILKDLSNTPDPQCTDEGRAMMQIIHDVAPESPLAFYTAFESDLDFANGIVALADAGSKVIVDDILYFAEPMFQDGVIAQATDIVKSRGVTYFSAAGNDARASYEAPFRASGETGLNGGVLHNFSSNRRVVDTRQGITATPGSATLLSFQWDEPWFSVSGGAGSASDVDIYFVDDNGDPVTSCFFDPFAAICQFEGLDFNLGGDPVELPLLFNDSGADFHANIVMEVFSGPNPTRVKYVYFDLGGGTFAPAEFDTKSGTVYGHANGGGAEAVAAAPFFNTQALGPVVRQCVPACIEPFSSAGGTPILIDTDGSRLRFPQVRLRPGVTAPDGANTTFFVADIGVPAVGEPDGFPNFFGTSAAAPHAAAVAALLLDQRARDIAAGKFFIGPRQLTPDLILAAMRLTARDVRLVAGGLTTATPIDNSLGYDFDSGFGLIDAVAALQLIRGLGFGF